jgi:hypothetical protein
MSVKVFLVVFLCLIFLTISFSGCSKEENLEQYDRFRGENSTSLFQVTLENNFKNKNGTYTWIWSVRNTNPGNGSLASGTAQDLVSWGFMLESCTSMSQIISGSTSPDGVTWNNFNPEVKSGNVIKASKPLILFEQGTFKSEKSYYKLVVSRNFGVNKSLSAIYKSGDITGTGVLTISGLGCPLP